MLAPPAQSPAPPGGFDVVRIESTDGRFNKRAYQRVGARWQWTDRLVWTDQQWADYAARPQLHTWLARAAQSPVGYFELEQQTDGDVELAYFGLYEEAIGRGFGRAMLAEAIRQAWTLPGTNRLWVHTCSKDHPSALQNYRRRGFTLFKTEIEDEAAADE